MESVRTMAAYNLTRACAVASKVVKADSPLSRARGLLGRERLEPGEGLWIVPCSMIHTFFMRLNLDILFLDSDLRVLRVVENIAPWRISPWVWKAHSVLELAGGAVGGSAGPGDRLEFR